MASNSPDSMTPIIDRPVFDFATAVAAPTDTLDFTFGVVGSGGDGVITSGEIVEGALSSRGLYCILTKSFGPQIRGGESYVQLRASGAPVATEGDALDLVVVFSWKDFVRFRSEIQLKPGAVLLYDPDDKSIAKVELPLGEELLRTAHQVPFAKLAKQSGNAKNKNAIMLGILSHGLQIPREALEERIEARFARKGPELVKSIGKSFECGLQWAAENVSQPFGELTERTDAAKCVMTGNEAVAFGALYAGCRFFAGYPITPSTEIMEFMSRYLPRYSGRCVEVEDEIAAIGMCIGASFAGVKAMTGTSGPGLSLMSELLGLASIAELPLVIANVQRVGPSTGIPTKSEQSDLLHAAFGGHGDAARVVIAPCDVEDCFDVTVKAFFIAERYQLPVIILSDQLIGQRKESIDADGVINELEGFVERNVRRRPEAPGDDFRRYADTDDDVPSTTSPGTPGGMYQTSGLEHDEQARPTSSFTYHEKMAKRRRRKLEQINKEFRFLRWIGPKEAEVGILAWGSSKGAVKEAVLKANRSGKRVAALVPQVVYPVPAQQIHEFVAAMKRIVVVELSCNAQFLQLIQSAVNLPSDTISFARPGANPLRVAEVLRLIDAASGPEDRPAEAVSAGGA